MKPIQFIRCNNTKIQKVQREDSGICWLNNTAGIESEHFSLIVTEPIYVRIKPELLRTKNNVDVNFDCKVTGHPIEMVYWIHDGKIVKDFDRVRVSKDGLRLLIKNTQQGIYQCFASNTRDQAYGVTEYVINEWWRARTFCCETDECNGAFTRSPEVAIIVGFASALVLSFCRS